MVEHTFAFNALLNLIEFKRSKTNLAEINTAILNVFKKYARIIAIIGSQQYYQ